MEEGKPKLALQARLRGLEVGESAIPSGFTGPIEWGILENRPFLRAAQGSMLCQLRLGQRRKALALMEKILAWNPNDNQGIRHLIGSEYLRAGDQPASRLCCERLYRRNPMWQSRPDAARDLARLEPRRTRNRPRISGALRRPLAANAGGHCLCALDARAPKVLIERAGILECQGALLWEFDPIRRRKILDRENAGRIRINNALSKEIVQSRADRHGRQVAPWLHQAAHRPHR